MRSQKMVLNIYLESEFDGEDDETIENDDKDNYIDLKDKNIKIKIAKYVDKVD